MWKILFGKKKIGSAFSNKRFRLVYRGRKKEDFVNEVKKLKALGLLKGIYKIEL